MLRIRSSWWSAIADFVLRSRCRDGFGGLGAGVIKACDIHSAGALGAIRYVSDRRPGGVGVDINHILKPQFDQWD